MHFHSISMQPPATSTARRCLQHRRAHSRTHVELHFFENFVLILQNPQNDPSSGYAHAYTLDARLCQLTPVLRTQYGEPLRGAWAIATIRQEPNICKTIWGDASFDGGAPKTRAECKPANRCYRRFGKVNHFAIFSRLWGGHTLHHYAIHPTGDCRIICNTANTM